MKKILILIMALMLFAACGQKDETTDGTADIGKDPKVETPAQPQEPDIQEEPENILLTFTAVGDNLIHNTLSMDSETGDGYDFSHIYSGVADYIGGSDVAFINQEVPLDGSVGAYPVLGAPRQVADALRDIGFNVAALANNHMADRGAQGLIDTVDTLQQAGFEGIVGAYANKEAADSYVIVEKNGIKIGFLAYTYGLNSGLGSGNGWMIDKIDRDKMQADVNAIRPLCDFLAVSMHWGNEYQKTPSDSQREYASFLAEMGVDLIIGSHPHVLQPAQWIDRGDGKQTLCIYSLGNFASGQREQDRLLGGILKLTLEFSPEGGFVGYTEAEIEGVVTHYAVGNKGFALYMLEDYTEELAASHGLHKYDLPITLDYFTQRMAGIKESLVR